MPDSYDSIRNAVLSDGSDSRVEVNQRALIDKILARYASANAVYRELLQNSNDAEATTAQVLFTTTSSPNGPVVSQVVYRNNGLPFRPQDWVRLRRIAEGNPDVSKVGAFGVGAYTMFSICEEPMVISGGSGMAFSWRGDALWVKLGKLKAKDDKWTSFVLPSRDPYILPDLAEFGGFLCSGLTFTACLKEVSVWVDGVQRVVVKKKNLHAPRIITPPKSSSWWSSDGAITTSPKRVFTLDNAHDAITESTVEMSAEIDGDKSVVHARYVSAVATSRVPSDMAKRMERVTKKKPPPTVKVELFIDADSSKQDTGKRGLASTITDAFSPRMGAGRVFIGFKTSQTTGLAAHLAAPLLPTVEREAIDFQDPTLRVYNSELLAVAGILMRLTLEHSMDLVGEEWKKNEPERKAFEESEKKKQKKSDKDKGNNTTDSEKAPKEEKSDDQFAGGLFNFAKFMSSGVKKIADVISSVDFVRDHDEDLLQPPDPRPLSAEEKDAILLMRSFSPQQSTPDQRVGAVLARGFESCLRGLSPPVLTKTGIARGQDCRLPFDGIEGFVETNVVRTIVLKNAESYLLNVAGCQKLSVHDLSTTLRKGPIEEETLGRFLKWWAKFSRINKFAPQYGSLIKESISFVLKENKTVEAEVSEAKTVYVLKDIHYYADDSTVPADLPMPTSVLPKSLQDQVSHRVLKDATFSAWFRPVPVEVWVAHISSHSCIRLGKREEGELRVRVLVILSKEHRRRNGVDKRKFESFLLQNIANQKCIPVESLPGVTAVTDTPRDLYLPSAELAIFSGLGSFKKVSKSLVQAGVSEEFLLVLGVRKTISMDFLFSHLDNLKWNRNPKPLITYLRNASLTREDFEKLRNTQYLPEVKDKTRTYAPAELYLPNQELHVLPFVSILQWPSTDPLHERSADALFLMKLGCRHDPPLELIISYMDGLKDNTSRQQCLDFIYKRLLSAGPYASSYVQFMNTKFLPTVRIDPLNKVTEQKELLSPNECFSNQECKSMGFPVLDTSLSQKHGRGRTYADVFRCAHDPHPDLLASKLVSISEIAKKALAQRNIPSNNGYNQQVMTSFDAIFMYMSSRSSELSKEALRKLGTYAFIPYDNGGVIEWYRPNQIYFENGKRGPTDIVNNLFQVIPFSPFLAGAGVRNEPSSGDFFRLVISSPQQVLEKLGGEEKYKSLLRMIAANPPYSKVTDEMRRSPFLLAYRTEDEELKNNASGDLSEPKVTYSLAKAEDICVIDNSHFSRLFKALSAPQESDLEKFYISIGSTFISKRVDQRFSALGEPRSDTDMTRLFRARLNERLPLLISSVLSRPMVPKASALLADKKLRISQVSRIGAVYTYKNKTKTENVTCFARKDTRDSLSLFITQDLDWFHVGNAIGGVILVRCNVEDAFFIGSLLEAPLNVLRARGFPVDRVVRSAAPVAEKPKTIAKPAVNPSPKSSPRPSTIPSTKPIQSVTNSSNTQKPVSTDAHDQGYEQILQNMYPECREDYIRKLLGANPSMDSMRDVANQLADGNYPRQAARKKPSNAVSGSNRDAKGSAGPSSVVENESRKGSRNGGLRKSGSKRVRGQGLFGNMLNGLKKGAASGLGGIAGASGIGNGNGMGLDVSAGTVTGRRTKEPANGNDEETQQGVENVLKRSINSSRSAPVDGVSAPEQKLDNSAIAKEIIPSQDLKAYKRDQGHNGRTENGLRVFASQKSQGNEEFLARNWSIVERFSHVLVDLCQVYEIRREAVSIFYETSGKTIAFNSNQALFFNLRYFANLHFASMNDNADMMMKCYSYWFTTMAHELAHNMTSAHDKQHGFYTESYVSTYMPKLLQLLHSN